MTYKHYMALKMFRVSVELGFIVNMGFVLPALLAPRYFESLGDFGQTNTLHWLQNTALLLAIVTVMYIPAIRDPFRYLFISILLVVGRFAAGLLFLFGVLFMNYPEGMKVLSGTDLVLATIQALLLYRILKDGDPRASRGASP